MVFRADFDSMHTDFEVIWRCHRSGDQFAMMSILVVFVIAIDLEADCHEEWFCSKSFHDERLHECVYFCIVEENG